MKVAEIERIMDNILARTEQMIREGKRESILNEQFFHHQFSSLATRHYVDQKVDPYKELIIIPDHPTKALYSWKEFNLNRPKTTQKNALDSGHPGKFDFVIRDDPRIHMEWKGPALYTTREVAQDLTKLLMLEGRKPVKIFAAIITSATEGDQRHIHELTTRFYQALEFAQVILEIDDIHRTNLHAYIATVPDSGAEKFIWGKV